MDERHGKESDPSLTATALEHELSLVGEALAAVGSGRLSKVTIAGLWFGAELLPSARAASFGRGVRVRPLIQADEHGTDLVVERIADDASDIANDKGGAVVALPIPALPTARDLAS